MGLRVFQLSKNRYLETTSVLAFLASCGGGKTLSWMDIAQSDPATLEEFLSQLQLHPLLLEGCLEPTTIPKSHLMSGRYLSSCPNSLPGKT